MSEIITVHGNLTAAPVLRHARSGTAVCSFSIASNRRRYNRATGAWEDRTPVYHRVVAFGRLGSNVAASLRTGSTVTVTGEFTDDSFTPEGSTERRRRIQIEATEVGASLKWATVALTRNGRDQDSTEPGSTEPGTTESGTTEAAAESAATGDETDPGTEGETAPGIEGETAPAARRTTRTRRAG